MTISTELTPDQEGLETDQPQLGEQQEAKAEEEKKKVEILIKKYGKPRTVVHKTYKYGSDYTDGVLTNGCCDVCAYEEQVQEGHFACVGLSEDLRRAEEEGLVNRIFEGNNWWVVLDSRFSAYYEIDVDGTRGWGED